MSGECCDNFCCVRANLKYLACTTAKLDCCPSLDRVLEDQNDFCCLSQYFCTMSMEKPQPVLFAVASATAMFATYVVSLCVMEQKTPTQLFAPTATRPATIAQPVVGGMPTYARRNTAMFDGPKGVCPSLFACDTVLREVYAIQSSSKLKLLSGCMQGKSSIALTVLDCSFAQQTPCTHVHPNNNNLDEFPGVGT